MNLRQQWSVVAVVGLGLVATTVPVGTLIERGHRKTEEARLRALRADAKYSCGTAKPFENYCNYRLEGQIAQAQKSHLYRPLLFSDVAQKVSERDANYIIKNVVDEMRLFEEVTGAVERQIKTIPGIDKLGEFSGIRWQPVLLPGGESPAKGFGIVFKKSSGMITNVISYDPVTGKAEKIMDAPRNTPLTAPGEPRPDVVAKVANDAIRKLDVATLRGFDKILQEHIQRKPDDRVVIPNFDLPSTANKI